MKLIDSVLDQIQCLEKSKAAYILAHALYSACVGTPGPSLLKVSVALDSNNRELFCKLVQIAFEPDYSNSAQDNAKDFIEAHYGEHIESWRSGHPTYPL